MDERRKSRRINLTIDLEYDLSEYQKWVEAHARNLSEDGICIITARELPVGTAVELKFTLPDSNTSLRVSAKVIWNEFSLDDDFYIQGLEFGNLSPDSLQIIRKYISAATFDIR
jgi:uncharacterized protein (TIGR02266 family)